MIPVGAIGIVAAAAMRTRQPADPRTTEFEITPWGLARVALGFVLLSCLIALAVAAERAGASEPASVSGSLWTAAFLGFAWAMCVPARVWNEAFFIPWGMFRTAWIVGASRVATQRYHKLVWPISEQAAALLFKQARGMPAADLEMRVALLESKSAAYAVAFSPGALLARALIARLAGRQAESETALHYTLLTGSLEGSRFAIARALELLVADALEAGDYAAADALRWAWRPMLSRKLPFLWAVGDALSGERRLTRWGLLARYLLAPRRVRCWPLFRQAWAAHAAELATEPTTLLAAVDEMAARPGRVHMAEFAAMAAALDAAIAAAPQTPERDLFGQELMDALGPVIRFAEHSNFKRFTSLRLPGWVGAAMEAEARKAMTAADFALREAERLAEGGATMFRGERQVDDARFWEPALAFRTALSHIPLLAREQHELAFSEFFDRFESFAVWAHNEARFWGLSHSIFLWCAPRLAAAQGEPFLRTLRNVSLASFSAWGRRANYLWEYWVYPVNALLLESWRWSLGAGVAAGALAFALSSPGPGVALAAIVTAAWVPVVFWFFRVKTVPVFLSHLLAWVTVPVAVVLGATIAGIEGTRQTVWIFPVFSLAIGWQLKARVGVIGVIIAAFTAWAKVEAALVALVAWVVFAAVLQGLMWTRRAAWHPPVGNALKSPLPWALASVVGAVTTGVLRWF